MPTPTPIPALALVDKPDDEAGIKGAAGALWFGDRDGREAGLDEEALTDLPVEAIDDAAATVDADGLALGCT